MNEKEAREILTRWKDVVAETEQAQPLPSKIMQAKGYLTCFEQMKPLVDALEKIANGTHCQDCDKRIFRPGVNCYCNETLAQEALGDWRKVQGKEK